MECRIWYQRSTTPRGKRFSQEAAKSVRELGNTHACIMKRDFEVSGRNPLESVFLQMQGENWNSDGVANDWLRRCEVGHSSMSVGDVVEVIPEQKFYVVANFGFEEVPR